MRKTWKVTKRILVGALGLILVVAVGGFARRAYGLHRLAKAVETPNGINEALFVRVGGIDQWVTIRGQNRNNPVLLFLHGGPGFALLSLNPQALIDWERDFTLVQWDQRGAGKTYGQSGPLDPGVTIDRMALDGVEVAEFLRGKLHQPRIILVGLSWGTILGIHMAKTRPDLFYAYVGTGQVANYPQGRVVAYAQLMAEARARGDRQAVLALEAVGPPPYDSSSKEGVLAQWATAYEPGMPSTWSSISTVLFDSAITFRDVSNLLKGMGNSEDHFRGQLNATDLPGLGADFAIPIFVFQGALDNVAPVAALTPYVDSITAPQKQIVLIAGAGHNVMVTKSSEFLRLLVEWVRPLAIQREPAAG